MLGSSWPGPDPAIQTHPQSTRRALLDPRVEPGDDDGERSAHRPKSCGWAASQDGSRPAPGQRDWDWGEAGGETWALGRAYTPAFIAGVQAMPIRAKTS